MKKNIILLPFILMLCSCNNNSSEDLISTKPISSTPIDFEVSIPENESIESLSDVEKLDLNSYLFVGYSNSDELESYFGISNGKVSLFTDKESFDAFQNKVNDFITSEDYISSSELFNEQIDFTSQKVAISARYDLHFDVGYEFKGVYNVLDSLYQSIDCDLLIPAVSQTSFAFCYTILDASDNRTIEASYEVTRSYDENVCYKPIIYFYPEKEMELTIRFKDASRLLTTYPKYDDGWTINLNENGKMSLVGVMSLSMRLSYLLLFPMVPIIDLIINGEF